MRRRGIKGRLRPILISACLLLLVFLVCMRITRIRVTGNRMYTEEEITQRIFPDAISRNTVVCAVRGMLGMKKSIPFVQDYKVSFLTPTSVEIIVYEKSIVGYVSYMSSKMYFDKDGVIVESSSRAMEGIPEITGLTFGHIALYRKLPVENEKIFMCILNLTQTLSTNGLPVERIRYDSDLNVTLTMGTVTVLLGGAEEMNGKLSELAAIYPKIQTLSGTLDLSDYDPTNGNRMYSFKKQ